MTMNRIEDIVMLLESSHQMKRCIVLNNDDYIELLRMLKSEINYQAESGSFIVFKGINVYRDTNSLFSYSIEEELYFNMKKMFSKDYIIEPIALEYNTEDFGYGCIFSKRARQFY